MQIFPVALHPDLQAGAQSLVLVGSDCLPPYKSFNYISFSSAL